MSTKNYGGSKFNGLRDKERKANIYRDKSIMPAKNIVPKKFLNLYNKAKVIETLINNSKFKPGTLCQCGSDKTKKVYYTQNKAYKMCLGCKADLGDV